jgi:hypothetical protein
MALPDNLDFEGGAAIPEVSQLQSDQYSAGFVLPIRHCVAGKDYIAWLGWIINSSPLVCLSNYCPNALKGIRVGLTIAQ